MNWPEYFYTRIVLSFEVIVFALVEDSVKAAVTAFKSGFTKNLGAAIMNIALIGFYADQEPNMYWIFLLVSVTSRLNSFFSYDVFSDNILFTGLIAFVGYEDSMLLAL